MLDTEAEKDSQMTKMEKQIASLEEFKKEILECMKYPAKLAEVASSKY